MAIFVDSFVVFLGHQSSVVENNQGEAPVHPCIAIIDIGPPC